MSCLQTRVRATDLLVEDCYMHAEIRETGTQINLSASSDRPFVAHVGLASPRIAKACFDFTGAAVVHPSGESGRYAKPISGQGKRATAGHLMFGSPAK